MSKRPTVEVHPQQDAHACAWDAELWKNWPPSEDPVAAAALVQALAPEDDRYVIARSDSIENMYWGAFPGTVFDGEWMPLSKATKYTRDEMIKLGEQYDGFWMPLERALELETVTHGGNDG